MKNSIKAALGILSLTIATLFSCNNPDGNGGGGGQDTVVTKEFCGVPPDMMIELIRNYKREVWSRTSDTAAHKHDARYMEISIEQLENFIAYAKSSAKKDGLHLASVRMYYINYPGEKKTDEFLMANHTGNVFEDYAGCHSLALVPVVGANIRDAARRDYYSAGHVPSATPDATDFTSRTNLVFVPDNCGPNSTMENHNELCPPMKGCITGTLLQVADGVAPVAAPTN